MGYQLGYHRTNSGAGETVSKRAGPCSSSDIIAHSTRPETPVPEHGLPVSEQHYEVLGLAGLRGRLSAQADGLVL